jgi:circadian clock protein KaiC
VSIFLFDEGRATYLARAASLGMTLDQHIASGALELRQIDAAEMGAGEFASIIRSKVEEDGHRMLVIDSLNGFMQSIPDANSLSLQLHEMLTFLAQTGVTTLMAMAQQGLIGTTMRAPLDVTYIADNVLMLRFFEADGAILKSIAVVKKRTGAHENTLREFSLSAEGLQVGSPLTQFTGLLTGVTTYFGGSEALLEGES